MSGQQLTGFLGISLIVILTLGQDTALTIRNTLAGGRRAGIYTVLGVVSGQFTWAMATSVGLATILLTWQPAFLALKLAGAVYLVFLGTQALVAAVSRRGASVRAESPTKLTRPTAFRQGLFSNLGNAKVAVFFTSLLPQFVSREASLLTLLSLGVIFAAITFSRLSLYTFVAARAGDFLRRPAIRRSLDATMGAVLIAFGVRLAADR
jgi:threonine/homoserine/homoserine lactone efflux protein